MSNGDVIKVRIENIKGHMYNEIRQLLKDSQGIDNRLNRFRPSKHRKAYRVEKNLKKRCYVR